jgi:hypothetical protein
MKRRLDVIQVFFVMSTLIATSARCAGPILTAEQIRAAIQEGTKYKTAEKFYDKGLNGRHIELTGNTNVTFFNDGQYVALESAGAHQQMRELNADAIQATGLLHAYVKIHAAETWTFRQGNNKFLHSHLVLTVGDKVIQPVGETRVIKNDSVNQVLTGKSWVITLAFEYDVSPEDLINPVIVIVIDGDGHKHQKKVDLKGILNID